jgi:hypothetical protein
LKPAREPLGFFAVEELRFCRKEVYRSEDNHEEKKQQLKRQYLTVRGLEQ